MERASADRDVLVGEVAAVVYTDDRSGFGVVELHNVAGDRSMARATGPLARLTAGQPVTLHGRWTVHPRYGDTFVTSYFTPAAPRTAAALERFLASEHFPGIGPKLAASLVETFGLDLPDVVAQQPQVLTKADGITERLASVVVAGWRRAGVLAQVMARLAEAGVGDGAARWLVARFGEQAGDTLDVDPYVLLGAPRAGWPAVDRFARAQGLAPDDERRLRAAAQWTLARRRNESGDVAVAEPDLLEGVARLTGGGAQRADHALRLALDDGALVQWPADPAPLYLSPGDAAAEQEIAEAIMRLDREVTALELDEAQVAEADAELTAEQRRAVVMTFARAVSVLTGGPGTGKTRTVAAILRCAAALDLRVALCAPTGRAAKRLEELSGHPATTVHRLLEAYPDPDGDDRFLFGYGDHRRLPHDLVIADEWSMADLGLAHALITAIPDGGRLLLVGDVDQLPPVGPGAVLRDLLATAAAAGDGRPVAATALQTVHRQAAASRIITLAHELKTGVTAMPRGRDGDVFAVPQPAAGLAERVAEIVAVRAPAFFDCAPGDVQVLAPRYGGPAGVDRINEVLRERLNPRAGRAELAGFCEGDRVVQTRNNVELDIANGEVGEVAAVDVAGKTLDVAFATGVVRYEARDARDLRPAWCLTVHKSQGGQWPVVVLVLDPSHRRMLWRELVYTGVTRAVRGLLLVGAPHLLPEAARRSGSGSARRVTTLGHRLRAELER